VLVPESVAREPHLRIAGLERGALGSVTDHELGARQREREEGVEMLLDGEPANARHDRPLQGRELGMWGLWSEGAQVDAAAPAMW